MHDDGLKSPQEVLQPLNAALQECERARSEAEVLRAAYEGLVRAVSHDLRAPLRHLTSFAPLLRESVEALSNGQVGEVAEEAQEFLSAIEQSARKMGRMLDSLLKISRAAQQPMELHALELVPVVRAVLLEAKVPSEVVHWELPDRTVQIWGNAAAVHAMCTEVISNAVKFSAPQVRLRISLSQPDKDTWMLHVQDNGVGFKADRLSTSWPPFQRMHRESDFEGMGCGLALVHTLARRQDACLAVHAEPGQGCTTSLRWKAA